MKKRESLANWLLSKFVPQLAETEKLSDSIHQKSRIEQDCDKCHHCTLTVQCVHPNVRLQRTPKRADSPPQHLQMDHRALFADRFCVSDLIRNWYSTARERKLANSEHCVVDTSLGSIAVVWNTNFRGYALLRFHRLSPVVTLTILQDFARFCFVNRSKWGKHSLRNSYYKLNQIFHEKFIT